MCINWHQSNAVSCIWQNWAHGGKNKKCRMFFGKSAHSADFCLVNREESNAHPVSVSNWPGSPAYLASGQLCVTENFPVPCASWCTWPLHHSVRVPWKAVLFFKILSGSQCVLDKSQHPLVCFLPLRVVWPNYNLQLQLKCPGWLRWKTAIFCSVT